MGGYSIDVFWPELYVTGSSLTKNFFQTILDTVLIDHIQPGSVLIKRKTFMKDQERKARCQLINHWVKETLEQIVRYAILTVAGLVLFGLFALASMGAERLCNIWPQSDVMILVKIFAWVISIFGLICGISLLIRNTCDFLKFLIKGPPQNGYSAKETEKEEDK